MLTSTSYSIFNGVALCNIWGGADAVGPAFFVN